MFAEIFWFLLNVFQVLQEVFFERTEVQVRSPYLEEVVLWWQVDSVSQVFLKREVLSKINKSNIVNSRLGSTIDLGWCLCFDTNFQALRGLICIPPLEVKASVLFELLEDSQGERHAQLGNAPFLLRRWSYHKPTLKAVAKILHIKWGWTEQFKGKFLGIFR